MPTRWSFISDTVRGLLLDPKNEAGETAQDRGGERTWPPNLKSSKPRFPDYPDLMRSVSNLSEFTSRTLGDFHRQVLDTAESDPAGAIMLYNKDYPEIRDKRGKLFADLTFEIERVRNAEAEHADMLGWVGLAPFAIILLAIPIVGRVHSSTVDPAAEPPGRRPRTHAPGRLHRAPGVCSGAMNSAS